MGKLNILLCLGWPMKVREFRPEDYKGCLRVWKESRLYVGLMDGREDVMRLHSMNGDLFLVSEEDGEVVGTAIATFSGNLALIYHLAVLKGYRKRGIGSSLLEEEFRRLKAKGARFVLVFNHDSHRDARPFYRRTGFRGIGNFKGFYRKL